MSALCTVNSSLTKNLSNRNHSNTNAFKNTIATPEVALFLRSQKSAVNFNNGSFIPLFPPATKPKAVKQEINGELYCEVGN